MILKEEQTGTLAQVHGTNVAGVTLQTPPPVGQGPPSTAGPGQSRWSRGTAGHSSSPAPRGPALLTEAASAVSVVPAWAVVVVSLLPGVPPSTCRSKGNQVSLEVPAGSG